MAKIIKINHIAIVVPEIQAALTFWQDTLGLELNHIEEVPSQKSTVAFFPLGESEVELVKPTTNDSGVAKFLNDRGPGIHHLCFEVDNIDEMIEELKQKDVQFINEKAIQMNGRRIAFIHPKSANGVLIELYQLTE